MCVRGWLVNLSAAVARGCHLSMKATKVSVWDHGKDFPRNGLSKRGWYTFSFLTSPVKRWFRSLDGFRNQPRIIQLIRHCMLVYMGGQRNFYDIVHPVVFIPRTQSLYSSAHFVFVHTFILSIFIVVSENQVIRIVQRWKSKILVHSGLSMWTCTSHKSIWVCGRLPCAKYFWVRECSPSVRAFLDSTGTRIESNRARLDWWFELPCFDRWFTKLKAGPLPCLINVHAGGETNI